MKKIFALLSLILILTACQPTPETEIVIQKDFPEEIMEYENYTSDVAFEYEGGYTAPETIQESVNIDSGELTVNIDSIISAPSVKVFPVVLIKNKLITQEEADSIIFQLVGDKQLYFTKEKDKQDYLENIAYFKGILAELNAKQEKTDEDEIMIEGYTDIIEVYESDMQEAPDAIERQMISDTTFIQSEQEENYLYLQLECDMGKKEMAKLYFGLNTDNNSSYFEYYNLDILERIKINLVYKSMEYYDAKNIDNPNELEISVEEAKLIAETAANNIGFENYSVNTVSLAYKANSTKYGPYYNCSQCYAFYLTPVYYDIPITYEATQGAYNDYSQGWLYESLIICVDDSGIIYMKSAEKSQEAEKIHSGAELIDFDRIMDIFYQQIEIQGAWNDEIEIKSRNLYIDEITLGYMKIAVPDNSDEFILTPVWDFFGYEETEYDEETYTGLILDENNSYRTRNFRHSYLTINAIDGSIIDRNQGY